MDMPLAPLLEFCDVTKQFVDKTAISKLSIQLYPGMVVGLLGQNANRLCSTAALRL